MKKRWFSSEITCAALGGDSKTASRLTTEQIFRMKESDVMSNWISVDDRLPEENGSYICFCNDIVNSWFDILDSYTCPEYGSHDWQLMGGLAYPAIVTHWMPLPAPPIEDE